jgi:hypothetical protein
MDTLPIAQLDPPAQHRSWGTPGCVPGIGVRVASALFGATGQFDQHRLPPAAHRLGGGDTTELAGWDGDLDDAAASRVAPHRFAAAAGGGAGVDETAVDRPAGRVAEHVPPLGSVHVGDQAAGLGGRQVSPGRDLGWMLVDLEQGGQLDPNFWGRPSRGRPPSLRSGGAAATELG